ncbi:hypothetical protein AKJ16_DCAP22619, partial [Drosera capensis]
MIFPPRSFSLFEESILPLVGKRMDILISHLLLLLVKRQLRHPSTDGLSSQEIQCLRILLPRSAHIDSGSSDSYSDWWGHEAQDPLPQLNIDDVDLPSTPAPPSAPTPFRTYTQ